MDCACAKFFFDVMIVDCGLAPARNGWRTGLDLQVLSATARSAIVRRLFHQNDVKKLQISCFVCHLDCFQCLRYGTDLWLEFDQNCILAPSSIPESLSVFVTNRSSPTSCTLSPSLAVSFTSSLPSLLHPDHLDGNVIGFV